MLARFALPVKDTLLVVRYEHVYAQKWMPDQQKIFRPATGSGEDVQRTNMPPPGVYFLFFSAFDLNSEGRSQGTAVCATQQRDHGDMVRFGQVVVGPPGSGKTTYCLGMHQYLKAIGRDAAIVNLDPANHGEGLPFTPAVDIEELVSLEVTQHTWLPAAVTMWQ